MCGAAAFNGTPSIFAYTVGMQDANFGLVDAIAQAGGTGKAFDAAGGTQAFIAACCAPTPAPKSNRIRVAALT